MGPRSLSIFPVMFGLAVSAAALGDEPGLLAAPDEKLDHLLESWRGHSLTDLRRTWGRQTAIRPRGPNELYSYEARVRVRASILTGQVSVYQDGLVCTAWFEVDPGGTILRVTRQGGGRECWRAFRKRTPP